MILESVNTLHENVQVILNYKACQKILQKLNVYIVWAFELQRIKPHN